MVESNKADGLVAYEDYVTQQLVDRREEILTCKLKHLALHIGE